MTVSATSGKSLQLQHIWQLADPADIEWVRAQVDHKWLRLCLLVSALGPFRRLNYSELGRELGMSRATVTRWAKEIRAQMQK